MLTQLSAKSWACTRAPCRSSRGMTSLPKSWPECASSASRSELVVQECGVEHVDAHAGERAVGPARHRRRPRRLLLERRRRDARRRPPSRRASDASASGTSMQAIVICAPRADVVVEHRGRSPSCRRGRRPGSARIRDRAGAGCRDSGRRRRRCPGTRSVSIRCCAGSSSTNSSKRPSRKLQPRCTWRIRLCALYCVQMPMRRMPEFTQFDSAKSMIRNLPPNGSDGFARQLVSSSRRLPRPPARISASGFFVSDAGRGLRRVPRPTSASSTSRSVTLLSTVQPPAAGDDDRYLPVRTSIAASASSQSSRS